MASEKDLRHPEIGKLVEKYFKGIASVPDGEPLPHFKTGGKYYSWHGSCRLSHGIHAWRRIPQV